MLTGEDDWCGRLHFVTLFGFIPTRPEIASATPVTYQTSSWSYVALLMESPHLHFICNVSRSAREFCDIFPIVVLAKHRFVSALRSLEKLNYFQCIGEQQSRSIGRTLRKLHFTSMLATCFSHQVSFPLFQLSTYSFTKFRQSSNQEQRAKDLSQGKPWLFHHAAFSNIMTRTNFMRHFRNCKSSVATTTAKMDAPTARCLTRPISRIISLCTLPLEVKQMIFKDLLPRITTIELSEQFTPMTAAECLGPVSQTCRQLRGEIVYGTQQQQIDLTLYTHQILELSARSSNWDGVCSTWAP